MYLDTPHLVDMKNVAKCWKEFLCYFTTLETYHVLGGSYDQQSTIIENTSKKKVLGTTKDGSIILEDYANDKPSQRWTKGELEIEDYFTLFQYWWDRYHTPKVLSAISGNSLEMKGIWKKFKNRSQG